MTYILHALPEDKLRVISFNNPDDEAYTAPIIVSLEIADEGHEVIVLYDARYNESPLGQKISSYKRESIEDVFRGGHGIKLENGIPSWVIKSRFAKEIVDFLDHKPHPVNPGHVSKTPLELHAYLLKIQRSS